MEALLLMGKMTVEQKKAVYTLTRNRDFLMFMEWAQETIEKMKDELADANDDKKRGAIQILRDMILRVDTWAKMKSFPEHLSETEGSGTNDGDEYRLQSGSLLNEGSH